MLTLFLRPRCSKRAHARWPRFVVLGGPTAEGIFEPGNDRRRHKVVDGDDRCCKGIWGQSWDNPAEGELKRYLGWKLAEETGPVGHQEVM